MEQIEVEKEEFSFLEIAKNGKYFSNWKEKSISQETNQKIKKVKTDNPESNIYARIKCDFCSKLIDTACISFKDKDLCLICTDVILQRREPMSNYLQIVIEPKKK